MGRKFVLGDVHGAWRALKQCLDRANFDYLEDELICLGDVCDGWPETRQCVEELLKVRNLIYVLGNHDTWFVKWLQTREVPDIWYMQGGKETIASYFGSEIPKSHKEFFNHARLYFEQEGRLFVHAGIDPRQDLMSQGPETFLWDRHLAQLALNAVHSGASKRITQYQEVFIGHTPIASQKPICGGGVWLMDTGAGWSGVLSLMDIDTKQVFTSDPVPQHYPGITGRTKRYA